MLVALVAGISQVVSTAKDYQLQAEDVCTDAGMITIVDARGFSTPDDWGIDFDTPEWREYLAQDKVSTGPKSQATPKYSTKYSTTDKASAITSGSHAGRLALIPVPPFSSEGSCTSISGANAVPEPGAFTIFLTVLALGIIFVDKP